jgi:hypothetical protein
MPNSADDRRLVCRRCGAQLQGDDEADRRCPRCGQPVVPAGEPRIRPAGARAPDRATLSPAELGYPPTIDRTYRAWRPDAADRAMQADALRLADDGYVVTAQRWIEGAWGPGADLTDLLLGPGGGLLVSIYKLFEKGTLAVTYTRGDEEEPPPASRRGATGGSGMARARGRTRPTPGPGTHVPRSRVSVAVPFVALVMVALIADVLIAGSDVVNCDGSDVAPQLVNDFVVAGLVLDVIGVASLMGLGWNAGRALVIASLAVALGTAGTSWFVHQACIFGP